MPSSISPTPVVIHPTPHPQNESSKNTILDWVFGNFILLAVITGVITWKSLLEPFTRRLMSRISYSREQDNHIREALARIQAYTNADRVLLCQFLSRSTTNAGQQVYEMFVSHEVSKPNYTKAMPYGNYSSFGCVHYIIKSLNEKPFSKREIKSAKDDDYRAYLASLSVSYVVYSYITSHEMPIGFIALHYCDPANYIDWVTVDESDIRQDSDRILFILSRANSFYNLFASLAGVKK